MIPLKLVETIFHKYWALALPVLLIPLVVMNFMAKSDTYQSSAVVWTSNPVASEKPALGTNNSYLSAAQNQAQAVNDLLSTRAFRVQVAKAAGIIPEDADESTAKRGAAKVKASATTTGANLVTISAVSPSAEVAQAVVREIISQYLARATSAIASDSQVSLDYYTQQLALAQQNLDAANAALSEYLRSNPRAADPSHPASQEPAYRTLVERADSQSTLVGSLQNTIQTVQLRAASAPQTQASMFAVQDPATKPEKPLPVSMTSKYGMPAAGAMLGLFVGLAYLYVSYRTDHTIRSAEDLQDVPVALLGSVPQLQPAPMWARYTPVAWVIAWRKRDFARQTAASITTSQPAATGAAPEIS